MRINFSTSDYRNQLSALYTCIIFHCIIKVTSTHANHHHAAAPSASVHAAAHIPQGVHTENTESAPREHASPITPADAHALPAIVTTSSPEAEFVDLIDSIDVTAHEIIILTSKVGPPDYLQVAITVVDIETWHELPPINLTGIFILVTRGRYTINFLTPNRWYGVTFRCEQRYPRSPGVSLMPAMGADPSSFMVSHVNEEKHLVKTHKEDGSHLDSVPLVGVTTRRFGNFGKSLENLVVTIKWEQHPSERPNLDAIANVTLFCKQHIKYKQLRLYGREIEKSVEVKLDNNFEIIEFYNKSRQIVASITPKNCPRICWNIELVAETPRGVRFRRAATRDCQLISAVSAATNLRDYLGYELYGGNLKIRTKFTSQRDHANGDEHEPDAYIQLTAVELFEPKANDNSTVRFKTFSTSSEHANDFVLEHLKPQRLYAVEYKYGKESPFAYAESRRFIVETPADSSLRIASDGTNGTVVPLHGHWPIRVIIERVPLRRQRIDSEQNLDATNIARAPQHQQDLFGRENKMQKNIFESINERTASDETHLKEPVRPVIVQAKAHMQTPHSQQVEIKIKNKNGIGDNSSVTSENREELDDQDQEVLPPKIVMQLEPIFQDYKVGIDLEPFCELAESVQRQAFGEDNELEEDSDERNSPTKADQDHSTYLSSSSKSQFWLNRDRPSHTLRHLDVVGAVCGAEPAHPLCRWKFSPTHVNRALMNGAERCVHGAKLCYTPSIRVLDKLYAMDRRCVDVAKQIAIQMATDEAAHAADVAAVAAAAVRDSAVASHTRPFQYSIQHIWRYFSILWPFAFGLIFPH